MAKSNKISNKKQLQEMPMQFDSPNEIKPHKSLRQNLANNNTPLKKIPFPSVPTGGVPRNFQELLATERYREVLQTVKNYTGRQSITDADFPMLMQQMMQAYQQIVQIEAAHRTELQQLAIELVQRELGVNEGDINYDARLVGMHEINANFQRGNNGGDDVQPDIDDDSFDQDGDNDAEDHDGQDTDGDGNDREDNPNEPNVDDEDAKVEGQLFNRLKDLNLERAKRRFINAIVQGASKRGHYMYHFVSDRLREVTGNDRLINLYGVMMSVNDLLYWVIPDNYVDATGMGRGGMEAGGGQNDVQWGRRNPNVGAVGGNPDDMNMGNNPDGVRVNRPEDDEEQRDLRRPQFGDQLQGNPMMQNMLNNPAGYNEIDRNQNIPTVVARAFCFPVLLHELVKGTMEVIAAHGLPQDEEMATEVIELEDVLSKELWDLRLGPAIWARLRSQLPEDVLTDENQRELQNFIFAEFFSLPAKQFLIFAREVVSGSEKGTRLMKELVDEITERLNAPEDEDYDYGQSKFRRDLDSMNDDLDDDDMDDWLGSLGITRPKDDE